jgi:hypothetical protein
LSKQAGYADPVETLPHGAEDDARLRHRVDVDLVNKPIPTKRWANRVPRLRQLASANSRRGAVAADRPRAHGIGRFVVWTGDPVSDQPRIWALRLPSVGSAAATIRLLRLGQRKAGK